ncbi:MAG: tryptophan synthase subunit alpha [Chloroflexota bacterium]|nr:MAG: tryptophan synthase subunit alpha [Chloroflexota bacterium]
MFRRTRAEHRVALLPYVMSGFPTIEATPDLVERLVDAGADGLELGVPFSDPMADGPTIQRASQRALENGVTSRVALDLLEKARARVNVPIALMGYVNPIARFGYREYCRAAASAGADALIVPDVPPEESEELGGAVEAAGLDLVAFIAPTTSDARLRLAGRVARGFIYCVSVTGVTGARLTLNTELAGMLARARAVTTTPLVVGFGISRPEHVTWLVGRADGAIVASALIDAMDAAPNDPFPAAAAIVETLRRAGSAAATG